MVELIEIADFVWLKNGEVSWSACCISLCVVF